MLIVSSFFGIKVGVRLTLFRPKVVPLGSQMSFLLESEVAQSCPTLCDPVDCSPLGSSAQGILQPRILEWVAISSSRESSQPRDCICVSLCLLYWQAGSLPLALRGKPLVIKIAKINCLMPVTTLNSLYICIYFFNSQNSCLSQKPLLFLFCR